MKTRILGLAFYCIWYLTFSSCTNTTAERAQRIDASACKDISTKWNDAHNTKDSTIFGNLFADTVLFYGSKLPKKTCLEKKMSLFKKIKDFTQEITDSIAVKQLSNSLIQCNFTKIVQFAGKKKTYPSYLLFASKNGTWQIVAESDSVTDANLAGNHYSAQKTTAIPKNAVKGDYNGDGKQELMWLEAPKTDAEAMDCTGGCISYIRFSDPSVPSIKVEQCIGGEPVNHGDLNKNGTDEIGLLPSWFTSCWSSYYVWTQIDGKFVLAVDRFEIHCIQWDAVEPYIEIDPKVSGNVIIRYSKFTDKDIVVQTKSVKIRK